MKILHIYNQQAQLIQAHVKLLCQYSACEEVTAVSTSAELQHLGAAYRPDIVHLHGCWNHAHVRLASSLQRFGARLVLSPHHQLQPWVMAERKTGEKWPKLVLWQRRLVSACYSVVASGSWEQQRLQELGWNNRIELVPDATVTCHITAEDMGRKTDALYRKVMDSSPMDLLSAESLSLLSATLKAGITGDMRWVAPPAQTAEVVYATTWKQVAQKLSAEQWRHLYVYTYHDGIDELFRAGIDILGLPALAFDAERIDLYLPQQQAKSRHSGKRVPLGTSSHPDMNGDKTTDERTSAHETALHLTRQIAHCVDGKRLSYHLLTSLAHCLRDTSLSDERLMQELSQQKLNLFFAALMPVLAQTVQMEEGYMPCSPLDNKTARDIRSALAGELRILS